MITKEFNLNYANNMVYRNSKLNNKMLVDGGYVTFGVSGTPKYHFYQNDHLGNVRVVTDANGTGEDYLQLFSCKSNAKQYKRKR